MAQPILARLFLPLLAVLSASATQIQIQPLMVTADNPDLDLYRTLPNTGYDGVAFLNIATSGGAWTCSGALLSTGHLLTAAHCLTDQAGRLTVQSLTANFFPGGVTEAIGGARYIVHPDWNGFVGGGNDIALVVLETQPSVGVQRYDLYEGASEVGAEYEAVGFGVRGYGASPSDPAFPRRRSRGWNTFDTTVAETFAEYYDDGWTGGEKVLISDFDSGSVSNDALSFFYPDIPVHLGLGMREASGAPGDSGGPAFIGGQLAGLYSFRLSWAYDDGSTSDVNDYEDSSFGEFNGFTRTSSYRDWVYSAAIPEPSTAALCLLSLVAIGYLSRRRSA